MAGPALGVTIQGKGIKETARDLDAFKKAAAEAEKATLSLATAEVAQKKAALDALKANKDATKEQKAEAEAALKTAKAKESAARATVAATAAQKMAAAATAKSTENMKRLSVAANAGQGAMNAMRDELNRFAGSATGVAGTLATAAGRVNMFAAAAVAAVGALGTLGVGAINAASEIEKLSKLSNAGTTEFQRWAAGAKSVGFDMRDIADTFKDFNDRVGDFNATGAGPMVDFFDNIAKKTGVTIKDFKELSGPGVMQLYYDTLVKAGASQQDLTFYMETMASESTKLIPLLANGGEEMQKLADRTERLGGIMSDDAVRGLSAMKQGLTDLGTATGGLISQLGATFAPMISSISQGVAGVIGSVARAVSENGKTISFVFETVIGTAIVAATAYAAKFGVTWAASMVASTGATFTLVGALTSLKAALIATGIGAIVVAAGMLVGQFVKLVGATGSFGNALGLLGEVASGVWEGIKTSADAIPLALSGVWNTVKANFLDMAASITGTWANVLRSFGLDAAAEGIATGIHTKLLSGASDAEERAGADKAAAAGILTKGFEAASAALEKLKVASDAANESVSGGKGLGRGIAAAGGSAKDAKNELSELQKKVQDLNKAADAGRTPIEKYRNSLAELEKLKSAGLSGAAYSMEIERINDEFAQSVPIIGTVSDALGGFFSRGLQGFAEMRDAILGGFKKMLADMVSMAIRNKIMIPLMTGGVGGATAASAAGQAAAGGGGGVGSLLSGGGLLGSAWSGASGLFTASLSGIGSAGTYMSAIMGGATSSLSGFAAAAGAIAAPIAAVAAVFSFFSKKTKELDAGLRINVNGLTSFIEEFRTIETKRFWGLSKKVSTSYEAADQDAQGSIGGAVNALQTGIVSAAKSLEIGADVFSGFAHTLQISTKGLSDSEAIEAIQAAVLELGDAFAGMIPGLESQIRDGETASTALDRLAQSMSAVRNVTDLLGHAFDATGIAGAVVADSLASAFGGLDAMASAADTYFSAFYSEAERVDITTRRATDALAALGVAMPRTRDEYRAMIESLDLTNGATHNAYAALVSMAGVMDQILPSVSGLTAALSALQGNVSTGLEASIQAANAAAQANATAASNWYKASNSIRDWIAKLRGTAGSLTSPEQARAFNEAQYQSTLARAMAGDLTAAQDITGAADRLLASVNATARTQKEAAFAEARVLSDLGLLAGAGDIEGARHDVIRGLLEQQSSIMQQVSDYIGAGNALTEDMITTLETQLSGLDDAIAAAEMINYAYMKERLQVTVDVLADASIPEYLKTLLGNAANGVTGYIDFITRSDLTPDLKWLALTGASEHIKTIEYLAKNDMGADLTKLALETVSHLQKSVDFVVGRKLDPQTAALAQMQLSSGTKTVNFANGKTVSADVMRLALAGDSSAIKTVNIAAGKMLSADMMRIALAGNSELSRTVTATLSADIDPDAKKLALGAVGAYAVAIQAAFAPGMGPNVKRLLISQQGDYATNITAAISADMPDAQRRILLAQQGGYVANITGVLVSNMDSATKTLLLNANTQAVRAVTISAVFADILTADQKAALSSSAQTVNKTIKAAINTAGLSETGALYLAQIGIGSATVQKTLAGKIALSTLSDDDRMLLSAISETVTKSVAFKATGSATEDQLRLLGAVSASVLREIDFDASGSLTSDQRKILSAVDASVQRTLDLAATGTLTAEQQIMLATSAGTVTRKLSMSATGTLSDDQKTILATKSAEIARKLSMTTSGKLSADQKAILATEAAEISRNLAMTTTGALTEDQKQILATRSAEILRKLSMATSGKLSADQKQILAAEAAEIARKLSMTATGWLSADQKQILATEAAEIARKLSMSTSGKLTADQRDILDARAAEIARKLSMTATGWLSDDQEKILAATSGTITRTVKAWVDMTALNDSQKALVKSITGADTGKLTLGGTFVFDPTTGFKTWYETQTKNQIATPMSNLGTAMGNLWTALDDLKKGIAAEGKRQADAAEKAAKISDAQAWLSSLAGQRDTAVGNLQLAVDRVREFDNQTGGNLGLNGGAAQLGLTATGRLQYSADAVYGGNSADIQQWREQFWAAGGLEDQMLTADDQVAEVYARMQRARDLITSLGGVPSFAGGGYTGNGARVGGMDGMGGFPAILHPQEVVVDKTQGGFQEIVMELMELRRELAEFKDQSRQIDQASFDQQRKVANRIVKWDSEGMPPTRVE